MKAPPVPTIVIAAALFFVPAAAPAQDEEFIEHAVRAAQKLLDEGKPAEALAQSRRAVELGERTLDSQPRMLGQIHALNGLVALDAGKLDEAERSFRRAAELSRKSAGADHPETLAATRNLAMVLAARRRFQDAESQLRQIAAALERKSGPPNPLAGRVQSDLGSLYLAQSRAAEAEAAYGSAVAALEAQPKQEPAVLAQVYDGLGQAQQRQYRARDAARSYRRAIALAGSALGDSHPHLAVYLNNLAVALEAQGRYFDAEEAYRQALAIHTRIGGADKPDFAASLGNLAKVLFQQDRVYEAVELYRRATAITAKNAAVRPADHVAMLTSLSLAELEAGRKPEAREAMEGALETARRAFSPDDPETAALMGALARVLVSTGDLARAAELLRTALDISERRLGPRHPATALALNNLAGLLLASGGAADAEPYFERAVAIAAQSLGESDPLLATASESLALLQLKVDRMDRALAAIRRATAATRERLKRETPGRGATVASRWSAVRQRFAFHAEIAALAQTTASPAERAGLLEESFAQAEEARRSSAAVAVSQAEMRIAAGDGELAELVRERQDFSERWRQLDRAIVKLLTQSAGTGERAEEQRLRDELAEAGRRIDAIDARLAREFPAFSDFVNPQPIALADLRNLLRPDEALLAYLVGPRNTLLYLVRRGGVDLHLLQTSQAALTELVSRVRDSLIVGKSGKIPAFAESAAYELHARLIAPAAGGLAAAKHLFIVADGPLTSLPFALLTPARKSAEEPDWLIHRHGLTTLPAAASLRALKRASQPRQGAVSFLGFGDPSFAGQKGAAVSAAGVYGPNRLSRLGRLQQFPPLPDTADELRELAKSLRPPVSDIFLGPDATEARVKAMDLRRYRVVAFATHGLMAGEFDDALSEPALVLTPPSAASEIDDGLLTASEVARLKLDADWVILSACNTAAADGSPGAEGLSGLARAFFYAGARALLVSHWSVETTSARLLTTGMFEHLGRASDIGRAEALRRSMLDLVKNLAYAHPLFWAPFVVVGDGGAAD